MKQETEYYKISDNVNRVFHNAIADLCRPSLKQKPTKMQAESIELKSKSGKLDLSKEVVRALWWKQPYASAMLIGKVETRNWSTNVRGKVLICVSIKDYSYEETLKISGNMTDCLYGDVTRKAITVGNYGQAIAIGDLVECRPMVKEDESDTYVQYREGLYCHIYQNVRAIKPFPIKGAQGWRVLTEEQKAMIELI